MGPVPNFFIFSCPQRRVAVWPWLRHRDDVIKWKHFRVTSPLCGEFTGNRWIPLTKASDAELWCFFDLRQIYAGDLRCHRGHYDITAMVETLSTLLVIWLRCFLTDHQPAPIWNSSYNDRKYSSLKLWKTKINVILGIMAKRIHCGWGGDGEVGRGTKG